MSWNNGNGQQRQMKMPELGKGWLRPPKERKEKSPAFSGLVNFEGQIIDLAIWYYPPKVGGDGRTMPETFSVAARRYDPNARGQQAPQQQQMQYPPQQPQQYQQPVYAQPAPGPAYAPGPQPPQNGGYAPAPGYTPPPPAAAPQQPQWGGQPAQGRPPLAQAPQAGYKQSDVPF